MNDIKNIDDDNKKNEKLKFIIKIIMNSLLCLSSLAVGILTAGKTDIAVGVLMGAFLLLCDYVLIKSDIFLKKYSYIGLAASVVICILFFIYLNKSMNDMLQCAVISVKMFFAICLLICLFVDGIKQLFLIRKENKRFFMIIFCMLFTVFLFIPSETMINNYTDYKISIQYLWIADCGYAFVTLVILTAVWDVFSDKLREIYEAFLAGICLLIYMQYIFFNGDMGLINGGRYDWHMDEKGTYINLAVWIVTVVLFIVFFFVNKKVWNAIVTYLPVFLLLIQTAGFVANLAVADSSVYCISQYSFDNSDQFVVSKGENVYMFVIDGADNRYIDPIFEENSTLCENLKDFTVYTNTCSVYDRTVVSLMQMMSGSTFDSSQADFKAFYDRLHDNGFTVNFYNYNKVDNAIDVSMYTDNYYINTNGESARVDYISIGSKALMLTGFQTLPFIAKSAINTDRIQFETQVDFGEGDIPALSGNAEYADALHLTVDESSDHYFVFDHVAGAHGPFDSYQGYLDATQYCLEIVVKYTEELKRLGLYDGATIIVTADHGKHDDLRFDLSNYPDASTPILMIKEPNSHHDEIVYNASPVYHTDFLKTILVNTGLYTEADGDRFGYSVYDFDEDSVRTRTWYNAGRGEEYDSNWYGYTYTGDREDLEKAVENLEYFEADEPVWE